MAYYVVEQPGVRAWELHRGDELVALFFDEQDAARCSWAFNLAESLPRRV